jgi:hypothetical protein
MENKNNISSITEVQTRIFQIIWTMPEIHKRKLLTGLEKWQSKFDDEQQSKLIDKREHFRIPVSLYVICQNNGYNFKDFTKDVSAGGIFIETKTKLSLDDALFMTLLHKSLETPVKATGKVVRVEPKGLGIKFINPIPGMSLL